jgi:hypothetical protein
MKSSHLAALASVAVTVHVGLASAQGYRVGGPDDRDGPASAPPRRDHSVANASDAAAPQGSASVTPSAETRPSAPPRPAANAPPERAWNEYAGIAPDRADLAMLRRWARQRGHRAGPVVAWPGFQLTSTGSRIFLAVSSQATVTPVQEAGRRVYRIAGASVPLANNRRALETGAFATPVLRAFLRASRNAVDLVVELRATEVEPTVSQRPGPDGWSFIVLEFPPWRAPATASPNATDAPGPRTATTRPQREPSSGDPPAPDARATGADSERAPRPNLR